jgi:Polyprenyl synthetase
MTLIEPLREFNYQADEGSVLDPFSALEEELSSALSIFWLTAGDILRGSGVELLDLPEDYLSIDKNFFSALFLYSYKRAGIPRSRRILYGAVNQCLRGMVTGCDNILDDEYKTTLETSLPKQGVRFRSIIDIMVSDRVLFEILLRKRREEGLSYDQVISASAASLRALVKSGAQEASEEGGIDKILEPEEILRSVHHYKTGILFQCPWAVPSTIENMEKENIAPIMDALYRIGMGCQIMDDMVDLPVDARKKGHNYLISLIYHAPDRREWDGFKALLSKAEDPREESDLLREFPRARQAAAKTSRAYLEKGLRTLFSDRHRRFVEPTIKFLSKKIGAARFMPDMGK